MDGPEAAAEATVRRLEAQLEPPYSVYYWESKMHDAAAEKRFQQRLAEARAASDREMARRAARRRMNGR